MDDSKTDTLLGYNYFKGPLGLAIDEKVFILFTTGLHKSNKSKLFVTKKLESVQKKLSDFFQ